MKKTLTILTASYNRQGEKLQRLYDSLKAQTSQDFTWLLVDDGSFDGTEEQVNGFIKEDSISLQYIYKNNGGKHTALNRGIANIDTELTFIVDSDDYLTPDAVECILKVYESYKSYNTDEGLENGNLDKKASDRRKLCGFTFLRCFPDGKINGKEFSPDYLIASYIDVRINRDDMIADKAEVFWTFALKEFPFMEFENERFLGEDTVWIPMARKYDMVHINKAIYIGEYLEEGLTNNRRINNIKSPLGCMNRAKEFMKRDICPKYRIKGGLQYIIYGLFAGCSISKLIKEAENKGLAIICIVPGRILYEKWKRSSSV